MEGFKKLAVLFSVLLVSVIVRNAESCSCAATDFYTKFCESSFVAVVTIKEKSGFPDDYLHKISDAEYRVEVTHLLRVPENTDLVKLSEEGSSTYLKIYTPPYSSLCGITDATIGETYLIGGVERDNKIHIYLCGLYKNWNSITLEEQQDILKNDPKKCDIKVSNLSFRKV